MLPFVETDSEGFRDLLETSEKAGHSARTERIGLLTPCHIELFQSNSVQKRFDKQLESSKQEPQRCENPKRDTNGTYRGFILFLLGE